MKKEGIAEKPGDILSGGKLSLLMELIPMAREATERFRNKLLISELFIRLNWGAHDPADAAIGYGAANAALGTILSALEASFRVKKTDALVNLDYSLEKPNVYLRANLSISLMQAIGLGFFVSRKALGTYMNYRSAKKTQDNMTRKAVRQDGASNQ